MAKTAPDRNRKRGQGKKRRRPKHRAPRWNRVAYAGYQPRVPLDAYEKLALRVRSGIIDPRLKLKLGAEMRGVDGTIASWWFDLIPWDDETDDWALPKGKRGAENRANARESVKRESACYQNRAWVHNPIERYRIDYLGSPYAAMRTEGRKWIVVYFPGLENRKRALQGIPCVGELETRKVGDREIVDGMGERVALSLCAENPRVLARMLDKHIAMGKDPAKWDIDDKRAARIGKPRKPFRDDRPTLAERLGEFVNIIEDRALLSVDWRFTARHFDENAPENRLVQMTTF